MSFRGQDHEIDAAEDREIDRRARDIREMRRMFTRWQEEAETEQDRMIALFFQHDLDNIVYPRRDDPRRRYNIPMSLEREYREWELRQWERWEEKRRDRELREGTPAERMWNVPPELFGHFKPEEFPPVGGYNSWDEMIRVKSAFAQKLAKAKHELAGQKSGLRENAKPEQAGTPSAKPPVSCGQAAGKLTAPAPQPHGSGPRPFLRENNELGASPGVRVERLKSMKSWRKV